MQETKPKVNQQKGSLEKKKEKITKKKLERKKQNVQLFQFYHIILILLITILIHLIKEK